MRNNSNLKNLKCLKVFNQLPLILFSLILLGCNNVTRVKIVVDNSKKTISLLDSTFVIDSISISKFGKSQFTISLKNKLLGDSHLDIYYPNSGYKVYDNNLNILSGSDENLGLNIFIRKKGSTAKITEDIVIGLKTNPDIQVMRSYKYMPSSTEVDTIETDVGFK